MVYARTNGYNTALVTYTAYLNQLDLETFPTKCSEFSLERSSTNRGPWLSFMLETFEVNVQKLGDQNKGHGSDDWFEGRMIP